MKTKQILIFVLITLISGNLFAQKIKIKKGIVSLDGVEILKHKEDYGKDFLYLIENKDYILLDKFYYEVANPFYLRSPKEPPIIRKYFYTITFNKIDIIFDVDIKLTEFCKAVHDFSIFDADGNIIEENVLSLKKVVAKDMSSFKHNIIIEN